MKEERNTGVSLIDEAIENDFYFLTKRSQIKDCLP